MMMPDSNLEEHQPLDGRSDALLFAISGPGGTGKSTLIKSWRDADPSLGHVKSYTTRPCRPPDPNNGIDDRDWYHFVGPNEFGRLVRENRFAQWSHASSGYLSGTPIEPVKTALTAGTDLVFEYTPQLYLNLRQRFRAHVIGICVLPPSFAALRDRLQQRRGMTPEALALKIAMARQDLAYVEEHDYVVVNRDILAAVNVLRAIRAAEHARRANQQLPTQIYSRLLSTPHPMLFYYDPFNARLGTIDAEANASRYSDDGIVD